MIADDVKCPKPKEVKISALLGQLNAVNIQNKLGQINVCHAFFLSTLTNLGDTFPISFLVTNLRN